jgi:hypothetical protein
MITRDQYEALASCLYDSAKTALGEWRELNYAWLTQELSEACELRSVEQHVRYGRAGMIEVTTFIRARQPRHDHMTWERYVLEKDAEDKANHNL